VHRDWDDHADRVSVRASSLSVGSQVCMAIESNSMPRKSVHVVGLITFEGWKVRPSADPSARHHLSAFSGMPSGVRGDQVCQKSSK
jgi:hypothetical protein